MNIQAELRHILKYNASVMATTAEIKLKEIIAHLDERAVMSRSVIEEWNGEGLPPFGIKCSRPHGGSGWVETVIVGHSLDGKSAAYNDLDGTIGWYRHKDFRPICTEEDIAVEELTRIITNNAHSIKDAARDIYRKGYRVGGDD